MSGWLLDTNILSELRRPKPEPKVVDFVGGQPLGSLHVSAVTLAEIRFGIERLDDAGKRSTLQDWRKPGFLLHFQTEAVPSAYETFQFIPPGRRSGEPPNDQPAGIAEAAVSAGCHGRARQA